MIKILFPSFIPSDDGKHMLAILTKEPILKHIFIKSRRKLTCNEENPFLFLMTLYGLFNLSNLITHSYTNGRARK